MLKGVIVGLITRISFLGKSSYDSRLKGVIVGLITRISYLGKSSYDSRQKGVIVGLITGILQALLAVVVVGWFWSLM